MSSSLLFLFFFFSPFLCSLFLFSSPPLPFSFFSFCSFSSSLSPCPSGCIRVLFFFKSKTELCFSADDATNDGTKEKKRKNVSPSSPRSSTSPSPAASSSSPSPPSPAALSKRAPLLGLGQQPLPAEAHEVEAQLQSREPLRDLGQATAFPAEQVPELRRAVPASPAAPLEGLELPGPPAAGPADPAAVQRAPAGVRPGGRGQRLRAPGPPRGLPAAGAASLPKDGLRSPGELRGDGGERQQGGGIELAGALREHVDVEVAQWERWRERRRRCRAHCFRRRPSPGAGLRRRGRRRRGSVLLLLLLLLLPLRRRCRRRREQ